VILYLDTSALVKLYVDEIDSNVVREAVNESALAATSELSYVELRAALARRQRERALSTGDYRRVVRDIDDDWPNLFLITITGRLVREAAAIAERYRLRAYEAVHLGSSLLLQEHAQERVVFACWDRTLREAAASAKLGVFG
jgi:predicted nucleic acid-binding protein